MSKFFKWVKWRYYAIVDPDSSKFGQFKFGTRKFGE
jgi:hypothetical protein